MKLFLVSVMGPLDEVAPMSWGWCRGFGFETNQNLRSAQLSSARPIHRKASMEPTPFPFSKGNFFPFFFFFTVFIQFHKQKVCLYLSQIILHSSFTFFLYIYKKNHYSKCQSTVSFDNVCTSCSHLIKQRLSQTFEISFIIILFCTN